MVSPFMDDEEKLAAVRAALPAVEAGIYLNAGSVGPLPAETATAMADLEGWELRTGRAHPDYLHDALERMAEARAAVAAVLHVDVDSVALTHSTTDGMNHAAWSIDWRPGDRAVTTRLEHPGGVGALYALRERAGVDVAFVDVGTGADEEHVLNALDEAIRPGTRLVSLSHVAWGTGAVLPIRRVVELAHSRGALVAVDGAQSAGAIPVDATELGADFYAISAQKWLLGPEGMGALFVSPAAVASARPSFAGWFSFESVGAQGAATFWPDARRFEGTGFHRPSVLGMARSLGWLSMYVGLDWVHERGAQMARSAQQRLRAIPGVEVITAEPSRGTLVVFRIGGWPAQVALEELGARVFAIARTIQDRDAIRISPAFYTTEAELDRFAEAVALLAAHTPESIPPRRVLTILGQDA